MDEITDIILFDEEETTQILIESYLKELTFPYNFSKLSEFSPKLIPDNQNKKFIIVNISKSNCEILDKIQQAAKSRNNIIIIISYDNSADLHVRSIRAGAKEFLLKPIIKNDFVNALQKLLKDNINQVEQENFCVVSTILSASKETGKTFFALNTAKDVSDITDKRVLLIDFNNNLNDISSRTFMDFEFNTAYIVNEANKANFDFKEHINKYPNSNLYILGNGVFCSNAVTNIDNLSIFFEKIKKDFKYIFLDLNSAIAGNSSIVNAISDILYFILEPNLQMALNTRHMKDNLFPHKRARYVLNKFNPRKDSELSKEMEYILGRQFFIKIPKNYMATNSSIAHYKTLSEITPNVDVAQKYAKIAQFITGKD